MHHSKRLHATFSPISNSISVLEYYSSTVLVYGYTQPKLGSRVIRQRALGVLCARMAEGRAITYTFWSGRTFLASSRLRI